MKIIISVSYLITLILSVFICTGQQNIDLSKYRISLLSKSNKFNCTAFRITIPIDLNNDGLIDFITTGDDMGPCGTNGEISYLKFFENDGTDEYVESTKKYSRDSLWVIRPNWYLIEDFNNDGKKDIYITGEHIHQKWNINYLKIYPFLKPDIDIDTIGNFSFIQRRHHIYLSQSDGSYKDSPEFLIGMKPTSSFGITAIDYNKDGYIDIINGVQGEIEMFLNNGGKSMSRSTPFEAIKYNSDNSSYNFNKIDSLGGVSEGPDNLKFFDVNNDGYYDMIFNDRSGNALCMYSQNKFLDINSPIIKFDDLQSNDLIPNTPGSPLEIRCFNFIDIKKDGNKQLIEYWANGGGDNPPGRKIYQLIKVFEIKNGLFVDATINYFNKNENIGITYGSGLLEFIDLDNDGFIDLYPKEIDADRYGKQGYRGNDSTMYYRNTNGKFILKSLGLKYYFNGFQDMADSMKIYKYDTLHKFSIVNSLIPINIGKSNKIIFYSFGTEPGIQELEQYPNKYFINKQRQLYNDSLSTYFNGFIFKPNCDYLSGKFKEGNKFNLCSNQSKIITSIDTFSNIKYQWYLNNESISNTTYKITATKSGSYRLLMTDENNCSKFSDTVTIIINPLPNKPTFNTSKYSFCSGDSLKLSISNANKGDTLKWYFGTKSDLTNVTNKTFTDSTKLYVTRTDSIGCIISSDTIQITKNSIPIAPGISRDSDNNLVANTNGITWYKDGVKITDTTQKIKPTSNGNYTATTTQNGCTSSASANYYYLTSAVANLSSDEYFKVSPNPTDGEIYLNYNIRSTRDVYVNVVDMSGRTIISNRKVTSGSKLNLRSSMKGNYIIQVKDKSGRLLTTEKMIKN